MSARVNLLPREIEQRARARRTASYTVAAVAVFAALLGLIYLGKLGDLNDARSDRDAAQETVDERRAELASLEEFAQLDREVKARNALLSAAMATEISWARVLNDLALTFPPSSSMLSLEAAAEGAAESGLTMRRRAQPELPVGRQPGVRGVLGRGVRARCRARPVEVQ